MNAQATHSDSPAPTAARRWRRPAVALLVVLLLLLAVGLDRSLARRRAALAGGEPLAEGGQPAWVQWVMVGMGGFRGAVAEVLWLRANWLQERGRYLELVQLAEWITALDPRASEAWIYNAWNLAYNVSAMMPDDNDRVPWVAAGVALLRDRALRINPRDARLYRELGWIYQHKIGGDSDRAHLIYKLSLAAAMEQALAPGGALPPAVSREALLLSGELRLDLARLRAIEAQFGALDWRMAESHAIYWAWCGLACASGFDEEACRRMIRQNLATCVERGRFVGDSEQGHFADAPNLALIEPARRFYEECFRLRPGELRPYGLFLVMTLRRLHASGDEAGARRQYGHLLDLAGERLTLPTYESLLASEKVPDDLLEPRRMRKPPMEKVP